MKIKSLLVLAFLLLSSQAFAFEDFITTNYGFATDGYNFYVDETGYMGLKEALEVGRLFVGQHPIGLRGQDITAASNTPIWWDGDYCHVDGNAQINTLTKTLPENKEMTLYVTGTAIIKNAALESTDGYPMKLAAGLDAQGPILIKFIRDGNVWLEVSRTK